MNAIWTELQRLLGLQDEAEGRVDSVAEIAIQGNRVLGHRDDKIVIRGRHGKYKVVPYKLALARGIHESLHPTIGAAVAAARDAAHRAGLWAISARFGKGKAPSVSGGAQPGIGTTTSIGTTPAIGTSRSFTRGTRRVDIVAQSIAKLPERVDAIVSSDDNYLTHGGGVSWAIWHSAGDDLDRYMEHARPVLGLGQVFVSPAFELQAEEIIHAVTIDFDENRKIAPGQLTSLYRRVLAMADERGHRSVALPLIGGGAAGIDAATSTRTLVEALDSWFASLTPLTHVVVSTLPNSYAFVVEAVSKLVTEQSTLEEAVQSFLDRAPGRHSREIVRLEGMYGRLLQLPFDVRGVGVGVLLDTALRAVTETLLELRRNAKPAAVSESMDEREYYERSPQEYAINVVLLADALGLDTSPRHQALLTQGIQARNRLFHARSQSWSVDDVAATALAAREVLSLRLHAVPHLPSYYYDDALGASGWEVTVDESESDFVVASGSIAPATDRALLPASPDVIRPVDNGTAHVRALQQFLQTHLDQAQLQKLDAVLEARRYAGTADARLLEHCLRVDDPVEFIVEELGRARLSEACESLTGHRPPADATGRQVAKHVLEFLGFPLPRPLGGLALARTTIEQARGRVEKGVASSDSAVSSEVMRVARQIECVCLVLLRFLATAAYDMSLEERLRAWDRLPKGTVDKLGLGELISLVQEFDHRLAKDDVAAARLRSASVERRKLFPTNAMDIAELRNRFAHFREHSGTVTEALRRENAVSFFETARAFVDYLQDQKTRLFPVMIRVVRIEIDSWGRRRIHASDDEGHEEVIFTDRNLEPGRVYFMQPLSNPVRVDPILVPAGDLVWPDA